MQIGKMTDNWVSAYGGTESSDMCKNNTNNVGDFSKIITDISNIDMSVKDAKTSTNYTRFGREENGIRAPYSYLADDSGMIMYNGIPLQCDEKTNSLCLGDMSNPDDILTIPLTGGGSLKVNRDSIDGLAKIIGMFSPEDVKRIMDAIAIDAKIKSKKNEIEEEETKTCQNMVTNKINY